MLIYILKSSACLLIFFLFYKLFLEKVSFHIFKRFYLIVALVLSLIIPLLVFKEYVTRPLAPELENFHFSTSGEISEIKPPPGTTFDFKTLMLSIYGLGLLLFSLRFFRNMAQMVSRIHNNPKLKFPHCTQVLLQEKMPPHTFFRFIFLNKHRLENKKIPHEVLVHEETHAAQGHSWDVMFIELLQIAFWFNPLIVFFKRAIKLNHEFLADQAALIQTEDVASYQNILLEFAAPINSKPNQPALSNAIHYSSIKKRLTVMKTKTSQKTMIFRTLLLLPIAALLFFSFSTKKTIVSAQNTLASQAKVAPIKIKVNEKQELFVEGKPVSLEKLSTAINRLATSNDSANQSQPQVELDVTGNLGMALLNSIKKQLEKANAVLTMVTADSIKMTGENLEEAFKGIAFTAKDTLQITLDDGNTVLGTSTSPVQGVQETEPLKSTLSNKAPVPLSTTKQTGTVSLPLKTSDTLEISGSAEWPRVPMIAYRTDQGPISAELKNLVDSYAKLKKSYYDGVIRFVEHKQGSKEQLMHQYTQIMDLYKNYTKLATEEGVYALPEPSMSRMVWDRLPPHSQKLIDHVIGLAEKGAAFYLDDKKISTEKAVEQLKNNHELRINSMFEKDTVMEVKMSSF